MKRSNKTDTSVRYAVVGLGDIAQEAVLPAFQHAKKNSKLTALISGDMKKLKVLGKKYKVDHLFTYDQYEECLRSDLIDAVYIALPNSLHHDFTVRAARAGKHVLCEKPLGISVDECENMIRICHENNVKLMTAYRLHFEEANLKAVEVAQSGKLGDLKYFNSIFSMQVRENNIRTDADKGGGTLFDIGIYCINAARMIFRAEPVEVFAFSSQTNDPRFKEVDEMSSAMMRFPNGRLASFTTSFGAASRASYEIVGTKGSLHVDPAYEWAGPLVHELRIGEKVKKTTFKPRDQFAPELLYFSKCISEDKPVETSGEEGAIDVAIIEALYDSARTGRPVQLNRNKQGERPTLKQEMKRPKPKKVEPINAESPTRD